MTRVAMLAVLAGAVLLAGCSTSSGPGDVEIPDLERTSPERVLAMLTRSYEEMDADGYLDCLAEEFVFYTAEADQNDPSSPLPEDWDKATERIIHENMFGEETDVDRITLTLTNQSIDYNPGADPLDPADDTYSYVEAVDLRVYIPIPGDDLILLATADNMFVFGVDPDEVGPEGETLWEVKEWHDIQYASTRWDEASSWGRVKAMYR